MKKEDKTRLKYTFVLMFIISMVYTIFETKEQKRLWEENMDYDTPSINGDVRGYDYDKQEWMYYEPIKPILGPAPKEINLDPYKGYSDKEEKMIRDYIDYYHEDIIDEYGDE